jgi:hypothetical protein
MVAAGKPCTRVEGGGTGSESVRFAPSCHAAGTPVGLA